jgi:hypothetical protein
MIIIFVTWNNRRPITGVHDLLLHILNTERGGVILPRRHTVAKISISLANPLCIYDPLTPYNNGIEALDGLG